jgi:hypothetical protein
MATHVAGGMKKYFLTLTISDKEQSENMKGFLTFYGMQSAVLFLIFLEIKEHNRRTSITPLNTQIHQIANALR